jgi:tRNA(Ile)-lysidine synthase
MFDGQARVVVGVSGGPDSMALLYALVRLRAAGGGWPEPVIAHLDHALRPDSTADAEFVAAAAGRLGLAFVSEREDVGGRARAAGRNLEAVARELRYDFLTRAAAANGAGCVATGHTATDQAETVLMRLARGAGVDGLAGIAARRPTDAPGVTLVRPLLGVTREETLAYCRDLDIAYRVDPSNADTGLARAYTRAELLPRLERVAPGAAANLARAAALAADDRAYFADRVRELMAGWGVAEAGPVELPAADVAALPAALRRRVLREAVRRARGDLKRLSADHVDALERLAGPGRGGREAVLPYGLRARRAGEKLLIGGA